VPQLTNGTECGFFVLYYIYHFIQNDPPTFFLDDYPSFVSYAPLSNYIKIEVQEVVVDVSKKKHRGPTKLSFVHGLDNGKRIVVQINELGQPVGKGGHSLKLFLGTIARLGDKMSIDAPTWRAMSATHKDDVWEYVQRKYDIPAYLKEWVMKDLDQKWRSWKYELRNKYFDLTLKQNEQKIPPDPRVNVEQWKRVVQTWSSNSWKSLMLGKKVKLCDMEGHPVANAIIMSLDKSKMVMGKSLGEEYYEAAILFAYKPNAPLFVKDNERKTVQDAVGSHIVWFRDFVSL
ncbi:hypothetical protein Taro_038260, partial [Colocasia esculenta]|nr:hypothetical protein [Colocasia esculenta]